MAHFVHHDREAAPVVVAVALLVEEHYVVVGVVGEVALVVGQHEHAFDVGARADGDSAEELHEVPERVRAVFMAAEDLVEVSHCRVKGVETFHVLGFGYSPTGLDSLRNGRRRSRCRWERTSRSR